MLKPLLNSHEVRGLVKNGGVSAVVGREVQFARARKRSPYWKIMLGDRDLARWYSNVCRGSQITADVYLRRLCYLCASRGLTYAELVKQVTSDKRWAYNFDVVGDIVANPSQIACSHDHTRNRIEMVSNAPMTMCSLAIIGTDLCQVRSFAR